MYVVGIRKLTEQFQRKRFTRKATTQLCFIINEHDMEKKFIRFQLQFHLKQNKKKKCLNIIQVRQFYALCMYIYMLGSFTM